MHILVVGINHQTSPVEVRDVYGVERAEQVITAALEDYQATFGVELREKE